MSEQLPPPPSYPPPPPPYPPPPPPAPPARRPRPLLVVLAVVGALLVIAAAVVLPLVLGQSREEAERQRAAGLEDVKVYDDLSNAHTTGDVDYPQAPPVGGPHAPDWLECGVYDAPVHDENAVHDLEHGTLWITYDPDLAPDEVDRLEAVLPENGILSPYDGLESPVVVTVWGRQLALDGAGDPRLQLFIDTFGGGETAPEPFASCAGGIGDPVSGTSV